MMVERISSLDEGYVSGMLSLFPEAIDDKVSLYEAKNNAQTVLKQSLPFNAKNIIVQDATEFPLHGILRIGPPPGKPGNAELIYYGSRTNNVFKNLVRGFAGSVQSSWSSGSHVTNGVKAEHHNSVKDAVLNMQDYVGVLSQPSATSLHGILKKLEVEHLSPKPIFRAFPTKGASPLKVRFQNFSNTDIIRFLWDFGDGATSIERNPTHTYQTEGVFSVTLNVITSSGAQGIATKTNYITVDDTDRLAFFYVVQADPSKPAYSTETAANLVATGQDTNATPAEFTFIDQTDGDIKQRFWVFADGSNETKIDPNVHTASHVYDEPGEYEPSLLVVFEDEQLKRVFLQEKLVVL